jgi:hypothetical protein
VGSDALDVVRAESRPVIVIVDDDDGGLQIAEVLHVLQRIGVLAEVDHAVGDGGVP